MPHARGPVPPPSRARAGAPVGHGSTSVRPTVDHAHLNPVKRTWEVFPVAGAAKRYSEFFGKRGADKTLLGVFSAKRAPADKRYSEFFGKRGDAGEADKRYSEFLGKRSNDKRYSEFFRLKNSVR